MRKRTHFQDPCIHCGLSKSDVPVGECAGDPTKAIPIAYASLGVRWDKIEHFRVRYSDNRVEDRWHHVSERAPYHHFGHSPDQLRQPPRQDLSLRTHDGERA